MAVGSTCANTHRGGNAFLLIREYTWRSEVFAWRDRTTTVRCSSQFAGERGEVIYDWISSCWKLYRRGVMLSWNFAKTMVLSNLTWCLRINHMWQWRTLENLTINKHFFTGLHTFTKFMHTYIHVHTLHVHTYIYTCIS